MELPICHWQGKETGEGRHECLSPKILSGPQGVPDAKCLTRYCRNHPQEKAVEPARCPFFHRRIRDADGKVKTQTCGPCGGKTVEVFRCTHPALKVGETNHETTLAECQSCPYGPRPTMPDARKLILKNHLSPGDVLVMTAAVHSLHKANPGKFLTAVDTPAPALWENNPDVLPLDKARAEAWEEVPMHYPLIDQCNQRAVHFMQGYTEYLSDNLQVKVPLLCNRPMLYLSKEERGWMNQVEEVFGHRGRFWVVGAGRKNDFTTKFYGTENFQRVVDLLRGRVLFVQVGASEHYHPPLKNVLNLVGKTDQRQLVRLVWHAEGVLTGVSFLHHLAAALEKPAVCLLGGREPVCWNAYPKARLLHTIGSFPCCRDGGCWKSRTVKLNDGAEQDGSLCERPVPGEEPIPSCMAAIRPERVAEEILTCGHPSV